MNKKYLYDLIKDPDKLNGSTLESIRELVDQYPFFQAARLLLLKNLYLLDHIRYEPELKISASYVPDRKRLFELIYGLYPEKDEKTADVSPGAEEIQEADTQKKTSSVAITGSVKSVDEYFGVNEELNEEGVEVKFYSKEEKTPEVASALPEDMLFDYEKAEQEGYTLSINDYPLDTGKNRSFSDWLSALGQQGAGESPKHPGEKKNKTIDVIEKFLNKSDTVSRPSGNITGSKPKEVKEADSLEGEELMTETLAAIYIKQGHCVKALDIFEKLSLKYPEKSVYFAQQIKKLEKLISNQ